MDVPERVKRVPIEATLSSPSCRRVREWVESVSLSLARRMVDFRVVDFRGFIVDRGDVIVWNE